MIRYLLLSLLLTGCAGMTPEQAQSYAAATHTLVHGALVDAKDASSVYEQIKH